MRIPAQPCTRRSFLAGGLSAVGGSLLAACDHDSLAPLGPSFSHAAHPGALHLYADQSGLPTGERHFVVGLLVTGRPEEHEAALDSLRDGYRGVLRYSSNDRFKLGFARAAMDHVLAGEDLFFAAGVVGPGSRQRDGALVSFYERIIRESVPSGAPLTLHVEPRDSEGGPAGAELNELGTRLPGLAFQPVDQAGSSLQQVADLLTGSIFGDATREPRRRGTGPRAGASVKDVIIHELRSALGVPSLTHRSLADHPRFRVSRLRPPY